MTEIEEPPRERINPFIRAIFVSQFNGHEVLVDQLGTLLSRQDVVGIAAACREHLSRLSDKKLRELNASIWEERNQKAPAMPRPKKLGYIYLMTNKRNGYTKIGWSQNPQVREGTLQSEEPEVELLHTFTGSTDDEKALHKAFEKKRIRGEWFNLSESDIYALINEC